jgi:cell division cycle protein 20 (cofactor of APC complex)
MWDCTTSSCVSSIDTGSQVSALEWNRYDKEILSAHGYTQNQLTLWKSGEMSKIMDFHGHTARILNMSINPDGTQVVTAGADETLRFWNIFNGLDKPFEKLCRWSPGSGINAGYR